MTLLQRNYPHVKIAIPTELYVAESTLLAYGFATQIEDVAQITAKVIVAGDPPTTIFPFTLSLEAPNFFDWYALFLNLPPNKSLKLVVEAVDTHGNVGKDSHAMYIPKDVDAEAEAGENGAAAPMPIPNPVPFIATITPFWPHAGLYPSQQPVQATGTINDSAQVPTMKAKFSDGTEGTKMNSTQPGEWRFTFSTRPTGLVTLTISAINATPVEIAVDFG